jgi:hypothetical protein
MIIPGSTALKIVRGKKARPYSGCPPVALLWTNQNAERYSEPNRRVVLSYLGSSLRTYVHVGFRYKSTRGSVGVRTLRGNSSLSLTSRETKIIVGGARGRQASRGKELLADHVWRAPVRVGPSRRARPGLAPAITGISLQGPIGQSWGAQQVQHMY